MDSEITEDFLRRDWLSGCHDWRMIYADGLPVSNAHHRRIFRLTLCRKEADIILI